MTSVISVARDGEVIGEFDRETLAERAQSGDLRGDDWFWREGMTDWQLLSQILGPDDFAKPEPIPSVPLSRRAIIIAAVSVVAALLVVGLVLRLWLASTPGGNGSISPVTIPHFADAIRTDANMRDAAISILVNKLERLPVIANPPNSVYYSDLNVVTSKPPETLSAVIRGSENVVRPDTHELTVRADFTVQAEYREQRWIFRSYEETRRDLLQQTSTTLTRDDQYPVPPAIVTLMGLQN